MQIAGIEIITIEVSLLIVVIVVIRRVLADRLCPAVMKWLWVIPALRILIPVQVPVDGLHFVTFDFSEKPVVLGFWLFGVALACSFFLVQNAVFKRNVKRKRALYGKKEGLLVYFVDRHIGSCLVGLVHPQIYVSSLADSSLDWCKWIVRHELCHYRSMDHWYAIVRLLCLALQWFNPLVWYAVACSIEDLEIACDYYVVKDEERDAQIRYGECLIAMAAKYPQKFLQSITTGNALGKGSLKRRIERLGEGKERRSITGNIVIIGMLLLLGACFTVPDNSENSFVGLLTKIPYVKECILQYELTEPSNENVEQTVDAMRYRCKIRGLEGVRIYGADQCSLVVLLPPKEIWEAKRQKNRRDDFCEDMNYIIFGGGLSLHTKTEVRELFVSQDMFSIEKDSEGYSLWLDFMQALGAGAEDAEGTARLLEDLAEAEDMLYEGKTYICTVADENIKAGKIRLYAGECFDNIYDNLERICNKNPCELKLLK